MPDTPQSLANRLLEESGRVVDFFNQLSKDQWGISIYPADNTWSLHHLLAHFVSAEIGRKELIANVLAGGEGSPPQFNIDSFNHDEVEMLSGYSNDYLLELFIQERSKLAKIVSSMDMMDLERKGNDPYLGEVALVEMIKLTYRHLQIHLRDARRLL